MSEQRAPAATKLVDIDDALTGVESGATVLVGGWGECGTPNRLIAALANHGATDLTVIITGSGPCEPMFDAGVVSHCITTFGTYAGRVGAASAFERRFREGSMSVELCSQGVLAERIRAGGAGIPAFYVAAEAVGRFRSTGETRMFNGREHVLETALHADLAIIGASVADPLGNLAWVDGERNFNDPMAYAADLVVAEAFEMYEIGWMPAEHVMVPAIVVDRIVAPTG